MGEIQGRYSAQRGEVGRGVDPRAHDHVHRLLRVRVRDRAREGIGVRLGLGLGLGLGIGIGLGLGLGFGFGCIACCPNSRELTVSNWSVIVGATHTTSVVLAAPG